MDIMRPKKCVSEKLGLLEHFRVPGLSHLGKYVMKRRHFFQDLKLNSKTGAKIEIINIKNYMPRLKV